MSAKPEPIKSGSPKSDPLSLGLDFGLSNLSLLLTRAGRFERYWRLPTMNAADPSALPHILEEAGIPPKELEYIATTGGRHRDLPERIDNVPLIKIDEVTAIGMGGLSLARLEHPETQKALIVSAGSGTAMVAATFEPATQTIRAEHITGAAIGGGTLLGLGQLLLGTTDPLEIEALALQGEAAKVDITIGETIGGSIGSLPASATAVNFGRLGRLERLSQAPKREDIAAGLTTMIAQVIALLALNAARAQNLEQIVFIGHLGDLRPIRETFGEVWRLYRPGEQPYLPAHGGAATALGAVLAAKVLTLIDVR